MSAIEDRLAIDDLLTQYAVAIDTRNFAALDDIFTEDATLDYSSSGAIKGTRNEVRDWFAAMLPAMDMSQHFVTNRMITVDGDEAHARSYFFNPMGLDGKFFYVGGYYDDRLRRTTDGWRIVARVQETAFMDMHAVQP